MVHIRKTTVFIGVFTLFISLMSSVHLPSQNVRAQSSDSIFGPENFVKSGVGKTRYTRSFSAPNTLIPYTLTVINGDGNGSQFVKKATITLNGQDLVTLNKSSRTFVLAVRLQSQNDLSLVLKSPTPDGFVKISIEPTRTTLLNDPNDANFDSNQAGIGYPVGVSVDSASHRAYIADAGNDAIVEFDLNDARVVRTFDNVDGNSISGDSRTSGVCVNPGSRNIVAVSPADSNAGGDGMLSIINLDSGSVRTVSQGNVHPFSVASNANTDTAAFTALFNPNNKRAYFLDIASGTVTTRDESVSLYAVASNPITNEFVFTATDGSRNTLFVYEARAPFRRLREVATSARANTIFDKIAINPSNNLAVALNLREGAVFVFDLAAGQELARIPIRVVKTEFAEGDIAVNPETNMAVVINKGLNVLYVIDLATLVLRAELPLPDGSSPVGVGVDRQSNRAAITETGFSGGSHNGSVLVVQLPQR
jgi:DNA-binding beta-propeller fold protein YncE